MGSLLAGGLDIIELLLYVGYAPDVPQDLPALLDLQTAFSGIRLL